MEAVDPGAAGIDVKLAVDLDLVTDLDRDPLAQLQVVVELELVAERVSDLDVLVTADAGRRLSHGSVKRHFGTAATSRDVSVQTSRVRLRRLGLRPDPDRHEDSQHQQSDDRRAGLPLPRPAGGLAPPTLTRQARLGIGAPDTWWQLARPPPTGSTHRLRLDRSCARPYICRRRR